MSMQSRIESRMEKIRGIFQFGMSVSINEESMELLDAQLKTIENEFRSIGYEAAAMSLALKDLAGNKTFNRWKSFMQGAGAKHLTQVHVGLGWAIAQQQAFAPAFIKTLDPLMQCRVMDGYGYYEGVFRKRKTIWDMQVPKAFDSSLLHGYDQGVGRSIWYFCKGECSKIAVTVAAFPSYRHEDLWRGIGIACAYVGGYDETLLKQLSILSSTHSAQLAIGAALVARTRAEANSHTRYINMACLAWCDCSAEQAMEITVKTQPSVNHKASDACGAWVLNIEKALKAVKTY